MQYLNTRPLTFISTNHPPANGSSRVRFPAVGFNVNYVYWSITMEKIAHYNTFKEAEKTLAESNGHIIENAYGGYFICKHEEKCTCGMCPVLSTMDTWI